MPSFASARIACGDGAGISSNRSAADYASLIVAASGTGHLSVAVMRPGATMTDGLSAALFVLGVERGLVMPEG